MGWWGWWGSRPSWWNQSSPRIQKVDGVSSSFVTAFLKMAWGTWRRVDLAVALGGFQLHHRQCRVTGQHNGWHFNRSDDRFVHNVSQCHGAPRTGNLQVRTIPSPGCRWGGVIFFVLADPQFRHKSFSLWGSGHSPGRLGLEVLNSFAFWVGACPCKLFSVGGTGKY